MDLIIEIFKGILIGIANIIPGVSGGTMAVSMGIYDKLIYSITHLFSEFKKSVLTLLPYGAGMLIGIGALSFLIEYIFEYYPLQTAFAFIGLIYGGLPVIWKKTKRKPMGMSNILLFVFGFALIVVLQLMDTGGSKEVELSIDAFMLLKLFVIGGIASATMVIPGVSGSMILMLLGYYHSIIETITSTITAAIHLDFTGFLQGACLLAPFALGILAGIIIIAKIIEILLKGFESQTYSCILGLVTASPVAILGGIEIAGLNPSIIISSIVCLLICFMVPYKLFPE